MRLHKVALVLVVVLGSVLLGSLRLENLVDWAGLELELMELTVCPQGPPACQFSKIQEAIDAAVEGATIHVGEGTYVENLVITKSLRLIGAGQEKVTLKAAKTETGEAALWIRAEEPIQALIEGLMIGEPLLPSDPFETFSRGVLIEGLVQAILQGLTVSGFGQGVSVMTLFPYHFASPQFASPQVVIQKATISHNTWGISIWAIGHQLLITQVMLTDNIFGIVVTNFTMEESTITRNQMAGILISFTSSLKELSFLLKQNRVSLIENLISENTNGILLYVYIEPPSEPHPRWPQPQREYVEIRDLAIITWNRILDNKVYGATFATPQCVGGELGQEFDPTQVLITGSANEMQGNVKGDLCPTDFPWPPGFKK